MKSSARGRECYGGLKIEVDAKKGLEGGQLLYERFNPVLHYEQSGSFSLQYYSRDDPSECSHRYNNEFALHISDDAFSAACKSLTFLLDA